MKERPILFSGEMVKAILDGSKTQTRRPITNHAVNVPNALRGYEGKTLRFGENYGRLRFTGGEAADGWKDGFGDTARIWFDGDGYGGIEIGCKYGRPGQRLRVNDTGLVLAIKEVRAEQLQSISEDDAESEGVCVIEPQGGDDPVCYISGHHDASAPMQDPCGSGWFCARDAFRSLWDSIYHKKAPWSSNPFVWVIEFEVVK